MGPRPRCLCPAGHLRPGKSRPAAAWFWARVRFSVPWPDRWSGSVPLSGDHQLHVAAEIVQVPVRGGRDPKLGPAVPADEIHGAAADLHTVPSAAAGAGDSIRPGGDILQLRQDLVHDDVVHKCLFAVLLLLVLLLRQHRQVPQVFLHRPLRADKAAELPRLGAAQGGGTPEHPLRRAVGLMGLPADAAGDVDVVLCPVELHLQGRLAAGALHLGVGCLQRKDRSGPHDGFAALGAEVSKCPHLFFHGMRLLTGMFPLDEDYTTTRNSCTEFF